MRRLLDPATGVHIDVAVPEVLVAAFRTQIERDTALGNPLGFHSRIEIPLVRVVVENLEYELQPPTGRQLRYAGRIAGRLDGVRYFAPGPRWLLLRGRLNQCTRGQARRRYPEWVCRRPFEEVYDCGAATRRGAQDQATTYPVTRNRSVHRVETIALDAFGTLVFTQRPTRVYQWLLKATNTTLTPRIRALSMTQSVTFEDYVHQVSPGCSSDILRQAKAMLDQDLSSMTLFPDAEPALTQLRAEGFTIAVLSNLSPPYDARLQLLLHGLVDCWCLSFEIGAMKPEPAAFARLLDRVGCAPMQVLMIGDSLESDVFGTRRAGMRAVLVDRSFGGMPRPNAHRERPTS